MENINDTLSTRQSNVFLDGEGDKWFERNISFLNEKNSFHETEVIKRVLSEYKTNINNVLEIGCGNGVKLLDLCTFFNAKGNGIDPSYASVHDGNERINLSLHKDVKLDVGIASKLPYQDASFDLVYFGFCLYLLDRKEIFKAVAEADRVLKAGGFLAILDFDPSKRYKVPYIHSEGLFSYKTSYVDFFLSNGHYYLVAKDSMSHHSSHFIIDSHERISLCILYKETDVY